MHGSQEVRVLWMGRLWRHVITEDMKDMPRGLFGSPSQTQRALSKPRERAGAAGALAMWGPAQMICGPEGKAAHGWGHSRHLLYDFTATLCASSCLRPASYHLTSGTQEMVHWSWSQ